MKYAKFRCNLCGTWSDSVEELDSWFAVRIQNYKDYIRSHYYNQIAPEYNYYICPGCFEKFRQSHTTYTEFGVWRLDV